MICLNRGYWGDAHLCCLFWGRIAIPALSLGVPASRAFVDCRHYLDPEGPEYRLRFVQPGRTIYFVLAEASRCCSWGSLIYADGRDPETKVGDYSFAGGRGCDRDLADDILRMVVPDDAGYLSFSDPQIGHDPYCR